MSDDTKKDRIRIVNAGLIGPKIRTNNPTDFHPMIRNDWGITDRIRGMLGRYYAVYEGTKGTTLYNTAAALDSGNINASEGAWDKAEGQRGAAEFV